MELCKEFKTHELTEEICELCESFELDFQENIPQYLEDIDSILNCTVNSVITDYECMNSSLKLYGKTIISVTFIDSAKNVNSCMFEEDLNRSINLTSNANADFAKIELINNYSSQRLINQRKFGIHLSLKACIKLYTKTNQQALSACQNACIKRNKVNALKIIDSNICSEDFDEVFKISDISSQIKNIVNTYINCYIVETKIIKEKMLVKANIQASVLYKNDNGATEKCVHSFSINKIIELSCGDIECKAFVNVNPSSVYVKPKADSSNKLFEIEFAGRLCFNYYIYSVFEFDYIADSYITTHSSKISTSNLNLYTNPYYYTDSLNNELEFEIDDDISEILDLKCDKQKLAIDGGAITYQLKLCCIYYNSKGEMCAYESIKDNKIELTNDKFDGHASINITSFDYVIKNSNKIMLRFSIDYSAYLFKAASCEVINDIECLEKLENSVDAALVLYFSKANEEVWDIAKSFSTTAESIMSVNDLANDYVDKDRIILIPRM